MVNIRVKGASAEREICKELNAILMSVMRDLEYPEHEIEKAENSIQRNQNQTAVGGKDLVNTFGLAIEVKRQETLAINSWWNQCEAAALRNGEIPVLLYKQSRKPWKVVVNVSLGVANAFTYDEIVDARAEISFDDFKKWFAKLVRFKLLAGYQVKT